MNTTTSSTTAGTPAKHKVVNARYLTVTAMLSAIAFILMFLDFNVPFMPSFIQMDLSELPALIGAFSMGPVCGVTVCLVKNLLHLTISSTGGVGELSNFILGAAFVLPAGIIYKVKKNRTSALLGALLGAVVMAGISVLSNYFVVYPVYYNFMPKETIIAAYQEIVESIQNLVHYQGDFSIHSILQCLVYFNMPFTFIKGLCSVIISGFIYKPISPLLKGTDRRN